MRGDPTSDAYVFLDAGASVSTTVDLAAVGETGSPVYDFSEPGKYTINFISPKISHVARSEAELATSVDELGPVQMPSNEVTVEITSAPQSPKETEAVQTDPAAGLIYTTAGKLWEIDVDGRPVPLLDQLDDNQPDVQVSSDGRWAIFSSSLGTEGGSDVWLVDLETRERRNLTNTPDREEVTPVWWPGRPDVIVFGSGVGMEMMGAGYPTVAQIDGSGYQVLDDEEGGPLAPSLDGRMIAYGGYDNVGSIYHWDAGPEPFEPSRYGISVEKLYQPAWHPDGRRLAWKVGGDLTGEGKWQIGIAIFDLQAETADLLHPYEPIGGMFPHYLAWSPGGARLAFVTYQEPPAQGRLPNLWVIHLKDGEEVYVGAGVDPTWSPDGRQLAFTDVEEDEAAIAIAEVGTWQTHQLDLPQEVQSIRSWITPRSMTR
jgi:Tol biopolymer transport system component